jgi:acyl-CoA reductase-like NAD-dependent aldehyde dehydrogenase
MHAANDKEIAAAYDALQDATTPAQRAAIRRRIRALRASNDRAGERNVDCHTKNIDELRRANAKCQKHCDAAKNKPQPSAPGSVGPSGETQCAPDTHGCIGSTVCCYGTDTCCTCKSGQTICCIYSDCRCCG